MHLRLALLFAAMVFEASAARQILFLTHSAGFRHDSIPAAVQALEDAGRRTGTFRVTATEDVSVISTAGLAPFDAVFFFTSGELPLSDQQKRDLLAFVRSGKGFGGAHSATDTLYSWPEYGELIGAYFDGHPWVQEVAIDVEDPDFPGQQPLGPSYRIVEEIYQFREFSRDRVRVLQTLDTSTVDLRAPGVNRADGDFALAWCRSYGSGRVYYTALGHFDETWQDARFQQMLEGALLWLVGDAPADSLPRATSISPRPSVSGVRSPDGRILPAAPGSLVRIEGTNLTSGSAMQANGGGRLPRKLAGTSVTVNGTALPLLAVAPDRIDAQMPADLRPGTPVALAVAVVNLAGSAVPVPVAATSSALLSGGVNGGALVLYASGLGEVTPVVGEGVEAPITPLSVVREVPVVRVNGTPVRPLFAGLAPTLIGVYQVNVLWDGAAPAGTVEVELEIGGVLSNRLLIPYSQTGFAADSGRGR